MAISDLLDPALIDLVAALVAEHGLPPGSFVLEITENSIIEEFERSKEAIASLRELGIEVSIDDFGAGVTSLAYLSGLSFAELKLDRRFISPLDDDRETRDVELVRATIALGHALGLRVIAEGVERAGTLELLTELGCDLAQGDCIQKPIHPSLLRFEPVNVSKLDRAAERASTARAGSEPVSVGETVGVSRRRLGIELGGSAAPLAPEV